MAYTEPSVTRVRPDPAQMWAGGVATAVVAALIALVGVLVCRWTLGIPILAPGHDGAWGSMHTGEFVLAAAVAALVATGLLHLLILGAPRPSLFFHWIMGLITVAVVVYPFSTGAPLDQKAATAIVLAVLGIAITSLLNAVAARAVRAGRAAAAGRRDEPPYRPNPPLSPGSPSDGRDVPPYDGGAAPAKPAYRPAPKRW
jgi:hypothetical protein